MRSAQALRSSKPNHKSAALRGQLYVDDPALVVRGTQAARDEALDLTLLWWLLVGIPLAWKKGRRLAAAEPHEWNGIIYKLVSPGTVHMEDPEPYLKDLVEALKPFCLAEGQASLKDAEK